MMTLSARFWIIVLIWYKMAQKFCCRKMKHTGFDSTHMVIVHQRSSIINGPSYEATPKLPTQDHSLRQKTTDCIPPSVSGCYSHYPTDLPIGQNWPELPRTVKLCSHMRFWLSGQQGQQKLTTWFGLQCVLPVLPWKRKTLKTPLLWWLPLMASPSSAHKRLHKHPYCHRVTQSRFLDPFNHPSRTQNILVWLEWIIGQTILIRSTLFGGCCIIFCPVTPNVSDSWH
jgi:hypothetical protein